MTWFRVGGAGIPATLKNAMNAIFNKKFGTSGQNYPPNGWPDDVNLMGPLPEKTIVSSPIADFSDGADDVPTKSLVVTIPPTLSGVSLVSETRSIGNFAELSNDDNPNKNAFTYTTLTPAKIEWEKTLSGGRFIVRFVVYIPKAGSYTFSEKNNTGGLYIYSDELWGTAVASNKATPYTHTFSTAGTYVIGIYNGGAIGTTGTLEEIACSYGSTATAYEPYETPTTYTASLGRTIYGGTADIVNGTGTDENGNDFTFDGQDVNTRLGYNAFWSDEGDTEVTYRADISLALQAVSSSRGLMMASRPVTQLVGEESDPDQVNELVENDETEQEGEDNAR